MIKEFIEKWENNKKYLEEYFRTHKQKDYDTYTSIVKKIIEIIINENELSDYDSLDYDYKNLSVIDDGDYQGTQIFIAHKNTYQPFIEDYIYTSNHYGSCSGCDTLKSIHEYNTDEYPSEEQIKDYMSLSLHLIQNFRMMKNNESEIESIEEVL